MRSTVVEFHRHGAQVDVFQAADVDGRHGGAVRSLAFTEGMHAAGGTEVMLDHMLVEGIGGQRGVRVVQLQLVAGHEPQQ